MSLNKVVPYKSHDHASPKVIIGPGRPQWSAFILDGNLWDNGNAIPRNQAPISNRPNHVQVNVTTAAVSNSQYKFLSSAFLDLKFGETTDFNRTHSHDKPINTL